MRKANRISPAGGMGPAARPRLVSRLRGVAGERETGDAVWAVALAGALALLLVVVLLTAAPSPALGAEGEECPNEAIRAQQGQAALALPDCRAYELVSPSGSTPYTYTQGISSVSGGKFSYFSYSPLAGAGSEGLFLLATRGLAGWSVQDVTPPQGALRTSDALACPPATYYSSELDRVLLADGFKQGEYGECEGDNPPLVPGEPRGVANLFLGDPETGAYELIDRFPEGGAAPANALLVDATPNLDHVLFSEDAKLTPEAPVGASDLYEWADGQLRLVTVLPDGASVQGSLVDEGAAAYRHAMSLDGERVIFQAEGALYMRVNAMQAQSAIVGGRCSEPEKACTVQIDAAEAGARGPGGHGSFEYASADGSRVFFTDEYMLTGNARTFAGEPDLYEYDVETGKLTNVSVPPSGAADVVAFRGASEDGSYVYFEATAVLTGGQTNGESAHAVAGEPNLYLSHAGVTTFVTTLDAATEDTPSWAIRTDTSPSGQFIAFNSTVPLTGYENRQAVPGECEEENGACSEIFLYDAGDGELSCASCSTAGEPPSGPAEMRSSTPELFDPIGGVSPPSYFPHDVLDDGRVFFDTRSPLVPRATNGAMNVYEYENGTVSLLSGGAGAGNAEFLDAGASGGDVFFLTGEGLVQGDTDNGLSVYDARVDGGFPASAGEGGEQLPACESAEACKPPPVEAPAQLFPASAAFSGPGDLTAAMSGQLVEEAVAKRQVTRTQRLAQALRACAKKPKRRRRSCEAQARRRFAVKSGKSKGRGR